MTSLLTKSLAVIEFDFLESIKNSKGWNNILYELFLLIANFEKNEKKKKQEINSHLILLAQNNLFIKKYGANKIEIVENTLVKNLNPMREYLIIGTSLMNSKDNYQQLMKLLDVKIIKYKIIPEKDYELAQLKSDWALIVEVEF